MEKRIQIHNDPEYDPDPQHWSIVTCLIDLLFLVVPEAEGQDAVGNGLSRPLEGVQASHVTKLDSINK